jgi:hypothetical protein
VGGEEVFAEEEVRNSKARSPEELGSTERDSDKPPDGRNDSFSRLDSRRFRWWELDQPF